MRIADSNLLRETRIAVALLVQAVLCAACTEQPCSQRTRHSFAPSNAVECPSGTLCYQGECRRACNAGSEQSERERCSTDSDCTDSARSTCNDGYCSACEKLERCVPTLNVCAPVLSFDSYDGGRVQPAGTPRANTPADGGNTPFDGTVFGTDAGTPTLQRTDPNYLGAIDLAQIERYSPNGQRSTTSTVTVEVIDIRRSGYVRSATIVEPIFMPNTCTVTTPIRFASTTTATDIGPIRIENASSRNAGLWIAGADGYEARFNGSLLAYVLNVPPPQRLLRFAETGTAARFGLVDIQGLGGSAVVVDGFPPEPRRPMYVPHELIPDAVTRTALSSGFDASGAVPTITVRWTAEGRLSMATAVVVRIAGPEAELRCSTDEESGELTVPSKMLITFRTANRANAGQEFPLAFERSETEQLSTPAGVGLYMTAQIRHSYEGRVRF